MQIRLPEEENSRHTGREKTRDEACVCVCICVSMCLNSAETRKKKTFVYVLRCRSFPFIPPLVEERKSGLCWRSGKGQANQTHLETIGEGGRRGKGGWVAGFRATVGKGGWLGGCAGGGCCRPNKYQRHA